MKVGFKMSVPHNTSMPEEISIFDSGLLDWITYNRSKLKRRRGAKLNQSKLTAYKNDSIDIMKIDKQREI